MIPNSIQEEPKRHANDLSTLGVCMSTGCAANVTRRTTRVTASPDSPTFCVAEETIAVTCTGITRWHEVYQRSSTDIGCLYSPLQPASLLSLFDSLA